MSVHAIVHLNIRVIQGKVPDREGTCGLVNRGALIDARRQTVFFIGHKDTFKCVDDALTVRISDVIHQNGVAASDDEVFRELWVVCLGAEIQTVLVTVVATRIDHHTRTNQLDGLISVKRCLDESAWANRFDGHVGLDTAHHTENLGAFEEAWDGS